MHAVFISYASEDSAIANRVCTLLESSGISCWIAPRDIGPGEDYPAAIVEAVKNAPVLLLIVTEASLASPHVLSEIGHAFNDKKRIVPFRLTAGVLPPDFDYFLSTTQWLNSPEGCTDESLKRLLDATREALAGHVEPHRDVLIGTEPTRKYWLIAGIAVLVLMVCAVLYKQWPRSSNPAPVNPKDQATAVHREPPATTNPSPKAEINKENETWLNPNDGQRYSWIPPGVFTMGCSAADSECRDNERPTHRVKIKTGFWLAQTEVTNAAYQKVTGTKRAGEENLPLTGVAWPAAKKYCVTVGGRLPTEAEWEYAARAGKSEPFYDLPEDIAWYAANSDDHLHRVAMKKPNAFGLYDMLGNVSEWVLDRYYNKYYPDDPAVGAVDQPLASNASAVARGGYWETERADLRVSHRTEMPNDEGIPTVGIRCAVDRK